MKKSGTGEWLAWTITILAAIAGCLWTAPLAAQPSAIALQDYPNFYEPVTPELTFYLDESAVLDAPDIATRLDSFQRLKTPYAAFGVIPDRVWLHFRVINPGHTGGTWRMDIRRQFIKELSVFRLDGPGNPQLLLTHDERSHYGQRKIPDRFLATDFTAAPGETIDFLIGYRSSSTTYLPIAIAKQDSIRVAHEQEFIIDWLLNGALLAMILIALLLVPVIGWRLGLSFSVYVLAGLFYVATADGYAFQYLWPDNPGFNDPANLATMLLMPTMALSFSRQLFGYDRFAPRFDRFLILCIVVYGSLSFLSIFLTQYRGFMIPAYAMIPFGALTQLLAGLVAFRGGRTGSRPYTIGAGLVLSSFVYAAIAHLVPGYFNLDQTLDYGHAVLFTDSIAFAVAIMLRLLALRNERDLALQSQLQTANEKLALSEALHQSREDYEDTRLLSERRAALLSNVSHDIRQPLNSLRLAIGRLGRKENETTEQMQATLDFLEKLAREHLVSENAVHARMPGTTKGLEERFPIRNVLDNVREIFVDQAAQRGIAIDYRPCDQKVVAEPVALMRAVNNLMSNAVEHSGAKRISLSCKSDKARLAIRVSDDGCGMEPDALVNAQQRFAKSQYSDGHGLGLSIIEELSLANNFGFDLQSTPGGGTCAIISVPLAP